MSTEKVPYSYWSGTQWVPDHIEVRGQMDPIWHVFNVVMVLGTFGVWAPIYLMIYLGSQADYRRRVAQAQEDIDTYYRKVLAQ